MPSAYDIYERKNYFNRFRLAKSVGFRVEVRETRLHVQAKSDLSAKAKDAVFRYRYQIEEYLRQHPAFRETKTPVEIFGTAPEIVRYGDMSSRTTGIAPMACISGAIADFVGRDLAGDSPDLVVSSGGDAYIQCSGPLEVALHAEGSPLHDRLILALPTFKKPFGMSTYVPGKGVQSVTVLSRSACWASAFAQDIGTRLARGESSASVLDRAEGYQDVGGLVLIAGHKIILGGDLVLRSENGGQAGDATQKAEK